MIIFESDNPENIILQQQAELLAGDDRAVAFAVRFQFNQYYLQEPGNIQLIALIYLAKSDQAVSISAAIFADDQIISAAIDTLEGNLETLRYFAHQYQQPWLNLSAPLLLEPVKIPKPWGQEIWYTGIESRGQSKVIAQGFSMPLPWVLALMPLYLAAGLDKKIILLKTLDPLPDEIYGDLYFELHERKQEVYIVTAIDSQAWKNQTGAIRLGFNPEKRAEFACDESFKAAYLKAVNQYEKIRRNIDELMDVQRQQSGFALDTPVDAVTLTSWSKRLPEALVAQEEHARHYMNSFSAMYPLRVGDVVKVPCYVPHALQHGVRTIEFQTPVYERKILSFAQKVLTQAHWDTAAALEKIQLLAPEQQALRVLLKEEGVTIEEIVRFDDFLVTRIKLAAHRRYQLPPQASYGVLMPIGGTCAIAFDCDEIHLAEETTILIPQALFANRSHPLWLKSNTTCVQILVAIATQI